MLIDCESAMNLVQLAVRLARSRKISVAVTVCDVRPRVVACAKMKETTDWMRIVSRDKAFLAKRHQKPTSELDEDTWGRYYEKRLKDYDFVQAGGLAIVCSGEIIGYIGVSGAREKNEEIAIRAIRRAGFDSDKYEDPFEVKKEEMRYVTRRVE